MDRDQYVAVEPNTWFIAEWADGTWCNWDERHEYTHMSDDYRKIEVLQMDPNGYYPTQTRAALPKSVAP